MIQPTDIKHPATKDPQKQEQDINDQTIISSLERYFQQTAQIRESSLPRWVVY